MYQSQDRLMLPWTSEGKESLRFKVILVILFACFLILSVWIPSISLPEKDRETLEKLPPQLAKFIKKKELPKPITKAEPKKIAEKKTEIPKPKEKPKPKKTKPIKINKPKPRVEAKTPELKRKVKAAREVAKKSGLLALQSDLADLRSVVDISTLSKKLAPRKAKTIARKAKGLDSATVLARSSGINTDQLSAPAETVALNTRDTASLNETVDEQALAKAEAEALLKINQRSEESILLVMERLKAAFNKIYIRELRKDPFLSGRLVLELVIESSGEVSSCKVISSELNNKRLERKMVNRMLLADFGAENVVQMTHKIANNFQPN